MTPSRVLRHPILTGHNIAMEDSSDTSAERLAALALAAKVTLAVTESLTGGALSCALAAAHESSRWYRGGVIAYSAHVKFEVLGVTPGPVVTARCAQEMAAGVAKLLGADLTVSTTGVGGPGSEEGAPPGTVFIGWSRGGEAGSREYRFDGEPDEVVAQTVRAGMVLAEELLRHPTPAVLLPQRTTGSW